MVSGYTEIEVEARIEDTISRAKEIVDEILQGNDALIAEIKSAMKKGVDMVTTTQLQEWAMAIPIVIDEIVTNKEAYFLSKELWEIEERQMGAKNLLELDMKKVEIENINRVSGTAHRKRKAIAQYVHSTLAGYQESLWTLSHIVRKMIDLRIASGSYV